MAWVKRSKGEILSAGDRIRMAGREGVISDIFTQVLNEYQTNRSYCVIWKGCRWGEYNVQLDCYDIELWRFNKEDGSVVFKRMSDWVLANEFFSRQHKKFMIDSTELLGILKEILL